MEYCHETIPTFSGLLLASQSPRRRQLLALLGIPFRSVCPVVEEETRADESPAALVARLSREKARAALVTLTAEERPFILACDTTVSLDGESVGKPEDADQATAMLHRLRSRPHAVFTAVTLLDAGSERMETVVARTDVYMPPFGNQVVEYIAAVDENQNRLGEIRAAYKDNIDEKAYEEMRTFRNPFSTTHYYIFFILLAAIILHINGVVITEVKEKNAIVSAMITGKKYFKSRPVDTDE